MASSKTKVVDRSQLSFMEIFDADERVFDIISAANDHKYELRFSSQMGYEIIRDSLYIMTATRSTLCQRIDEILWFLSETNQENLCSFTSCCLIAGLDPYETRMSVLHRWSRDLDEQDALIASGHYTAPTNMEYVQSQKAGFQKFKKAFYITYPREAIKRVACIG